MLKGDTCADIYRICWILNSLDIASVPPLPFVTSRFRYDIDQDITIITCHLFIGRLC